MSKHIHSILALGILSTQGLVGCDIGGADELSETGEYNQRVLVPGPSLVPVIAKPCGGGAVADADMCPLDAASCQAYGPNFKCEAAFSFENEETNGQAAIYCGCIEIPGGFSVEPTMTDPGAEATPEMH